MRFDMNRQRLFNEVWSGPLLRQRQSASYIKLLARSLHLEPLPSLPSTTPTLDETVIIKVLWPEESLKAAGTSRSTLTPSMYTDFRKASASENLLMHTEGDRTYVTNDVETVRKLLKRGSVLNEVQERLAKLEESHKKREESQKTLERRLRDHDEQARLRALIEMDLRCNNIRKSLLAFPNGHFKSTNGGAIIDPVTREERDINTHALLLSPCLHVCSMEAAESRHSKLFEAYFGISVEEAKSWSMHDFEDIELDQLFQKHSLLITNGVARNSLEPFKAFKRAMRELVRLADQKMDISNARAEAVGCAGEAIKTAEADEEIAQRLKLFTYATREKWSEKQPNPEENPYNWPAIIKYWQDEGHWDHVANHTNVTETRGS